MINRKGEVIVGPIENQVIQRQDIDDPQREAIETVAAMGAFVGENYDSISTLTKKIDEEKDINAMLQAEKDTPHENSIKHIEDLKDQHHSELHSLKDQIQQLTQWKTIV